MRLTMMISSICLMISACDLFQADPPPAERAAQIYAQAQQHLQRQELDHAARLMEQAIRLDPDKGLYTLGLGRLQARLGAQGQAIMNLNQAAKLMPDDTGALLELARILESMGKSDKAREHYGQAIERNGDDQQALLGLARLELEHGQMPAADKALARLIAARPDDAETYLLRGEMAIRLGRLDEAIEHLGRAVATQPERGDLQQRYGLALLEAGRTKDAIASLHLAASLLPKDDTIRSQLGKALMQAGELKEAEALFRKWREESPTAVQAHVGLSRVQLAQGNQATALASAREAVAIAADDKSAQLALVDALVASADEAQAIETLQRLCRQRPEEPSFHLRLAQLYRGREQLKEAIGELEVLLMYDPADLSVKLLLAGLYAQTGTSLNLAKDYVREALARYPEDPQLLALKTSVENAIPASATAPGDHSQDMFEHRQNLDDIMRHHQGSCRDKLVAMREYKRRFASLFAEQRQLTQAHFNSLGKFEKYSFVLKQRQGQAEFDSTLKGFGHFTKPANPTGRKAARATADQSAFAWFKRKCRGQAKGAKRVLARFEPGIRLPKGFIQQMQKDITSPRFRMEEAKQHFNQMRPGWQGLGAKARKTP